MTTRSLFTLIGLTLTVTSCSQSGAPITPRKPSRPITMAPTSAITEATIRPNAYNARGQQAKFQAEAASYRRAANLATGEERERLLQMAEQMDVQAAAAAP